MGADGTFLSSTFQASMAEEKNSGLSPDLLEVAPGFARERLEGWVPALASEEELRDALDKALDFRGDVTITRKDGTKIEGFVFDRRTGASLADSVVRLYPKDSEEKIAVPYADIASLAFSGSDPAAGRGWEAWVRKYWEKKMAGESNIGQSPDPMD